MGNRFFPLRRGGDRQLCELRRQIVKRPPDVYNYVLISFNSILVTDQVAIYHCFNRNSRLHF